MYTLCYIASKTGEGNPEVPDTGGAGTSHLDEILGYGNQSGEAHGGHERYQVFHFDFEGVQAAYVVSLWIFIASIAKIGMPLVEGWLNVTLSDGRVGTARVC